MLSSSKNKKSLQKEEILQAVVIANDYENKFSGFTNKKCAALLPIVCRNAIDYVLEFLGRSGIQETVIFCSSGAYELKKHVENSHWSQPASCMNISIIVSEQCRSLGDALRDIDNKTIIKGNFVLLTAFSISNLKLLDALKFHSEQCLKDKGTSMTMILQDVGSHAPRFSENIFVLNAATNQLLLQTKSNAKKKIDVPLECLLENANINIFYNYIDTGICICSPSVPVLFSDNFDFQTKEDFIKGVLLNQEVLDSRIYCYTIQTGYGATIYDWRSYQRVSNDIIHRWTFPLVPDQSFSDDESFYQLRNCIYKQPGVHLVKTVDLEMDVVIGKNSNFKGFNRILRSVIGKNCNIGKNVDIQDSYIFDNCTIQDNCKIQLCVVGEGVVIMKNTNLAQYLIEKNEVIEENSVFHETTLKEDGKKDSSDARDEYKAKDLAAFESDDGANCVELFDLVDPEADYSDDEIVNSSVSDSEESYDSYQEADDNILFYKEVVESLQRGFEEKVPSENLILEINSSRYAYNVMLKDVSKLTVKAILSLPSKVGSNVKAVLAHFLPLFKNYIKTCEAQMDCIVAIEEMYEELGNDLVKCIHSLYDNDVLVEDVILKWYNGLENDFPVKSKCAPMIKWLEEATEESSSEE